MTHTPGPWGVCGDGDCKCKQVWCDDHPVADVISGEWGDSYPTIKLEDREGFIGKQAVAYIEHMSYGEISEETAKANARLIAAAPDLLAALKEVEWVSAPSGQLMCPWCGNLKWDYMQDETHHPDCQRQQAIAKAEGDK